MKHWIRAHFIFAGLAFASALFAQAFNPASVRSSTCQAPDYNCGFQAPDPEKARSIPVMQSVRMRGLPSSVDLSGQMPPVSNQGGQNSCVAWATGYAMRSFHEQKSRNWGYDAPINGGKGEHVFSPAYIYNQINGGRDQGSVIENALELMVREGAAPWSAMPYNERDYRTQPNAQQRAAASSFRLERYARIAGTDLNTIKAELAAGRPVVFGMGVDDAFYQLGSAPYDQSGGKNYGGHAMTLVGYDDSKVSQRGHKGAFRIINSWGTGWGDRGFGWVSYQQWTAMNPWVLAVHPKTANTPVTPSEETQEDNPTPPENSPVVVNPPAEVTATRGSFPDKVVVTWSRVEGAAAYAVVRAEPGSDDFQVLAYADTNSYEDKAVQANAAYRYLIVAAIDNDHYSDSDKSPIAEGFASGNAGKPEKVTGLKAQVANSGGRSIVNLEWAQTPLAASYEIMRYDGSAWAPIGTSNAPKFTDNAPPPNKKVGYVVRGVSTQRGKWSAPVQVTIAGTTTPPAAPGTLRVSQGAYRDKITVEWDAVAGAQKYYVFRYSYASKSWAKAIETAAPSFEDTDPAVKSGGYFAYSVVAANAAGHSGYAAPVPGNANPNATRGVTLQPPLNVAGGVQNGTLSMSWGAVQGAQEYSIFRGKKGTRPVFVASVKGTAYSSKFAETPGELFFYTVRAKSEFGGESLDSRPVAAFINQTRTVVSERRISDEGLDRFAGNWRGKFLERGAKPHIVNMRLSGREQRVQGSMQMDKDVFGFRGPYARGSNYIVADEVEIRLLDFGLVEVRFNSPAMGEVVAVLEREH